ncbi:protein phosphatase [Sulfurifustis variabilis]|uniref:Protein phosphatase n=1 Tax=Sulfurifustis variabilis TaxID=1675686 RepID=A0A1B4V4X5_9GAMM|nr:Stp1/IreP family PP2C-type Ser/Thr phosphatase [Sulfurifustis variabilis]BAU48465.1 protein phosphatase [Sulfurifustis variabilis]
MTHVIMTGLSDRGRMREGNEDAIATRPELGFAVLADGMGGHRAGEVASRMAVDIVARHLAENLPPGNGDAVAEPVVSEAIRLANNAIYDAAQERPECQGMGSTIVVVLFSAQKLYVGHVGDSRLYRLHDGRLEQLTQDHSVIQELVNRGLFTPEEARQSVAKNLVTRALGVEPGVVPDISERRLSAGDVYLLCSDGLNDVLADDEIAGILDQHRDDLDAAARRMVERANEHGGPDNISVILARVDDPSGETELHEI